MNNKNDGFKLYIISGKARHGKSTLGEFMRKIYISRMKRVAVIQISHYIKDYAIYYFGWDGKEATKPRELLDKLGDVIRNKIKKPNFFIDRMAEDIEILSYFYDTIIIDDARLALEIDAQKHKFGDKAKIIHVIRDNFDNGLTEEEKAHITERDLDNYHNFDYVIRNNGSLDDLRKYAEKIIEKEE